MVILVLVLVLVLKGKVAKGTEPVVGESFEEGEVRGEGAGLGAEEVRLGRGRGGGRTPRKVEGVEWKVLRRIEGGGEGGRWSPRSRELKGERLVEEGIRSAGA